MKVTGTILNAGFGMFLPSMNKAQSSKDNLDVSKKRIKTIPSSKILHSYLQDAKASLKIDAKPLLQTSAIKKKYNLSQEEIENLVREEKIDPSVALLLKSPQTLNEPISVKDVSRPSSSNSTWSMSDTTQSPRPGRPGHISATEIGNVPLAGRIITDKGTYSAFELSLRSPPHSVSASESPEGFLSAADNLINKVDLLAERRKAPRLQKDQMDFEISKMSKIDRDIAHIEPDINEILRQIKKDDIMQRGVGAKIDYPVSHKTDQPTPAKGPINKTAAQFLDYKNERLQLKKLLTKPTIIPEGYDIRRKLLLFEKETMPDRTVFTRKEQHEFTGQSVEHAPVGKLLPFEKETMPDRTFFTRKEQHEFTGQRVEHAPVGKLAKTAKPLSISQHMQDLIVTGKEVSSLYTDPSAPDEEVDPHLIKKSLKTTESKHISAELLDKEVTCSDNLQKIWDDYAKKNKISEELLTHDLESLMENAQEVFEDYFTDRQDKTGQLMKSVTFSLKKQDTLSEEQTKLFIEEALVDPQMAHLLMTGKKEDCMTQLQLLSKANKLKHEESRLIDGDTDIVAIMPDKEGQLGKTEAGTDDVKSAPGKDADDAEHKSAKVANDSEDKSAKVADDAEDKGANVADDAEDKSAKVADDAEDKSAKVTYDAMGKEKVAATDGTATVPKYVTDENLRLEEGTAEVEKLSPDIYSMNEVLRQQVDMPTEGTSVIGVASDIDSALSKTGVSVPDKVSSVESISTAISTVTKDINDAGKTTSTEGLPAASTEDLPATSTILAGLTEDLAATSTRDLLAASTEDLPAASTEDLPEASTKGLPAASTRDLLAASTEDLLAASTEDLPEGSTEGLPAASIEGLLAASTEGLLAASTEGLPSASTEGLPAVSIEGLPAASIGDLPAASTEDLLAASTEDLLANLTAALSVPSTEDLVASNEDILAALTEELSAASTEDLLGASTEGLPAASTEDLHAVSTEGIPSDSVKSFPVISTEDPDMVPIGNLTTDSKSNDSLMPVSTPERELSSVSKLHDVHYKDDISIQSSTRSDNRSRIEASSDKSTLSTTTVSSASGARTTYGSRSKIRDKPPHERVLSDASVLEDNMSTEHAFKQDQNVTKQLSQKYGQDEGVKTRTGIELKGKEKRLSRTMSKKKSVRIANQKPLPDIVQKHKSDLVEKTQSEPEPEFESKISMVTINAKLPSIDEKREKPIIGKKLPQIVKNKTKRKETEGDSFASVFKDQGEKEKFIELGLEKILSMAKEHKQRQYLDPNKKQFRDPIEVRDKLHARREQLHTLIMGMSDENTIELESISQQELFEQLGTFEDDEINETLSLLTKVLHLDVDEMPFKGTEDTSEYLRKDETRSHNDVYEELKEQFKGMSGDKPVSSTKMPDKEIQNVGIFKVQNKPLPAASQDDLDENLFRNALIKMKTLNIFNAMKALGNNNPQMKDFDDYISQNRLTEIMDPVEIDHLRNAAGEIFLFKSKLKKGQKYSSTSMKPPKELKKMQSSTTMIGQEIYEPVDMARLQKRATLIGLRQELEMLSLDQRLTEPFDFSYYISWPDAPKSQKKPSKQKK